MNRYLSFELKVFLVEHKPVRSQLGWSCGFGFFSLLGGIGDPETSRCHTPLPELHQQGFLRRCHVDTGVRSGCLLSGESSCSCCLCLHYSPLCLQTNSRVSPEAAMSSLFASATVDYSCLEPSTSPGSPLVHPLFLRWSTFRCLFVTC